MKLWQIVVTVLVGVAVGLFEPGKFTGIFGNATLYVFLPALLFEAAWSLNYRAIARNWLAIAALAGPGVIVTALVVAALLIAVARVPFGPAFLTGAILSATDPIAVVAVFRRLKVSKTLATIVECESLFNDAVAVVLYRGVLAALTLGAALTAAAATAVVLQAIGGSIGGIALGCLVAFAVARLLRNRSHAGLQIAATFCCAFATYFAADYARLSGIFAVIAFGIALRYLERRWVTLTIAEEVRQFWDVVALVANVMVFFLVGAALGIGHVVEEPYFVVTCLVAIALARLAVAGSLVPFRYPREWIGVVRVAGVRGALSLALAIALPTSMPYRQAIVDATFAVALVTILTSALTTDRVVRRVARVPSASS